MDQYEVRTYRAWYRFMTLALFSHAVLSVVRHRMHEKKVPASLRLSLAEVRRLLRGIDAAEEQRKKVVWWSRFRRAHQARAKRCHLQRRARQAPPLARADALPEPICLPCLPALTDALWEQLRPLFEPAQSRRGRPTEQWRRRVEAVLWVAHTACSWRQLPAHFGPWETVVYHYRRWCKEGLWERVLQILLPPVAAPAACLSPPAP